jgi:hypothetical protein
MSCTSLERQATESHMLASITSAARSARRSGVNCTRIIFIIGFLSEIYV